MPLFLSRMCVKWHFVFLFFVGGFFHLTANTHSPLEETRQPVIRLYKRIMRSYWTCAVCCYPGSWKCTTLSGMNNLHKCKYTFSALSLVFQCPCYNSCMVQNLVWWKLHIVRLRIPPTEGDLRDLLWHSICAPKREIQIHLAGRSAGSVWGNPISHTGTPHPEREPSFHSGTVSAKWTPQPQYAALPQCLWIEHRDICICLLCTSCVILYTPWFCVQYSFENNSKKKISKKL